MSAPTPPPEANAPALAEQLNKIYRLVPGVVYQFMRRPDGTYCLPFASEAIRRIFQVTPEEVREDASPIFRKILPEDLPGLTASIEQSATRLTPWHYEFRIRYDDGRVAWLHGDSTPERASNGHILWHGFITDVTERHRMQSSLVESTKLESLGVLAGGIAHDFNNLLTGILGNASLARLDLEPTSPVQPLLDQIEQASRRAAELCKQMLAYSGKGRFVIQRVYLNRLVEDSTHFFQMSLAPNCALRVQLAHVLPAINADATQLRQAITNLVLNSSEAMVATGGLVTVSTGMVHVDADCLRTFRTDASPAPGDYVYVQVTDTGAGMDAATQRKIFDPFFTTKFTGRGLGLAAVLGIVRGHKGGLKVTSEPGRGTTFKLYFPIAAGEPEVPLPAAPVATPPTRGVAFVVDDEETVRTVASRMLERLGFTVVTAPDGREAVEIFRVDPTRFAFVLLDLTMPHLDGEETFRQMRQLNPDVRVLLTSGFNQQEAINRFTGQGLAGFVQKPFELATLTETIRKVVGE